MNIKRILCPIDFSFHSKAANYYASLFADASDSLVIYFCVNWPPSNNGLVEDRIGELRMKLITEVRPVVHGVRHEFQVRNGDPASEILKMAEERSIDLIVMGTHGTNRSSAAVTWQRMQEGSS